MLLPIGEIILSVLIRLRGVFYQVQCGILWYRVEDFVYAANEPASFIPLGRGRNARTFSNLPLG
ncbi:hypothetical protein CEQ31_007720 [Serratia odorifera]|nr:hypothetical protein CEQ31_007720 [Serratia odorifera]